MIEIGKEKIITFVEAAKFLPRRRAGRKPHVSTLYRWAKQGLRNVKLETIQVGGTCCTSVEALQRFFDTLSTRPIFVCHRNKKRIEEAEQKLRDAGI
ncbi:DUF1580 domain-containing protein [Gimesia aquarii]|uniref:DUF1580 domain-containing protein n=1 Tax=Gimesia aquarii TaxID=2527964 RepID=A0A517VQN2_9PLAN|nr:DUF1580 domain-containing protein [Gimesia aquarii]QDT95293.1 hypothetical protein V144x_07350 [Gimesia aquarii]